MLKHTDINKVLPVILAGGSGERLWPLSRISFPKQFLTLLDDKHSLLQNTILRLPINSKILPPLIVCNEEHRFIVAEQLRSINTPYSGILLEPAARNTAPAIALAAQWAQQAVPDCILLVLPADHLLENIDELLTTIESANTQLKDGCLVTFGIKPTRAETGYGYIHVGDNNKVKTFIEKPDITTARTLIQDPSYVWNSGMFCFTPAAYLAELYIHAADIIKACDFSATDLQRDLDFIRINLTTYNQCPSISIDYAVMEKTAKAIVFPLNTNWSDIGNWHAVWEQANKDQHGNYLQGDVVTQQVSNCMVDARHRLVAAMHVQDLAIIETSDAVLITHKSHAPDLKQLVVHLKNKNHPAIHDHRKVMRPWGFYETIAQGTGFQVKIISVAPGKSLSLQLHHHRSEHWVVVKGQAQVIRGNETFMLQQNESTFIPVNVKHQLINPSVETLEIIEVQSGSYLGEDDIVRFADAYGRAIKDTANV